MTTANNLALDPVTNAINELQCGTKKDRNIEIVKRHLGLDGQGGCSMEIAGKPHGLTRESVRQILKKYREGILKDKSCLEPLKKAVQILEKLAPVSASSAQKILVAEGFLKPDDKIEALINTASYLTVKKSGNELEIVKEKSFWATEYSLYIVTGKFLETPKKVYSRALKETSHNGASSVHHLAADINAPKEVRELFIRDLISTIPGIQWLDDQEDWFYFPNNGRNRLVTRLSKIFAFYEEVSFANAKEGIRRSINKHNDEISRRLPANVLKSLFASEGLVIDGEKVSGTLTRSLSDWNFLEFEQKIIEVIKSSANGIVNELKLENAVVSSLKEKYAFSMALNYSPLIYRVKRGQYSMLGLERITH